MTRKAYLRYHIPGTHPYDQDVIIEEEEGADMTNSLESCLGTELIMAAANGCQLVSLEVW